MTAYWEIADHSAYDIFSYICKYLIINSVFFPVQFLEWDFFKLRHFLILIIAYLYLYVFVICFFFFFFFFFFLNYGL